MPHISTGQRIALPRFIAKRVQTLILKIVMLGIEKNDESLMNAALYLDFRSAADILDVMYDDASKALKSVDSRYPRTLTVQHDLDRIRNEMTRIQAAINDCRTYGELFMRCHPEVVAMASTPI